MNARSTKAALLLGWVTAGAFVSFQAAAQSPAPGPTATSRTDAPLVLHVPPPPNGARPVTAPLPNVTTDTPEYCNSLHGRVDGMARDSKQPAQAIDLVREGQRLCETGKTRSGIMHLRRAFILMRQLEGDR